MYYDDYRFLLGPSVDDDPTADGPGSQRPAPAQGGQTSQTGGSPRMTLNGQSPRDSQAGRSYRQSEYYRPRPSGPAETPNRRQAPRKKNPWGKRIASLALCGLLFGGVAGLTFHGTTSLLDAGSSPDSGLVAAQPPAAFWMCPTSPETPCPPWRPSPTPP